MHLSSIISVLGHPAARGGRNYRMYVSSESEFSSVRWNVHAFCLALSSRWLLGNSWRLPLAYTAAGCYMNLPAGLAAWLPALYRYLPACLPACFLGAPGGITFSKTSHLAALSCSACPIPSHTPRCIVAATLPSTIATSVM